MTPAAIAIRVLIVFAFLRILIRLTGSRTVSQGTALDFVIALLLGDCIDDAIWAEVPVARFVVAAGVLTTVHAAVALGRYASPGFERLVEGRPARVLRRGKAVPDGMRRERMGPTSVARVLRVAGVPTERWHEVDAVWIEASGNASVVADPRATRAERRDRAALAAPRG